ncbi:hypothetical protein BDV19DRAFT_310383 [Aspergillus venezuelensis]
MYALLQAPQALLGMAQFISLLCYIYLSPLLIFMLFFTTVMQLSLYVFHVMHCLDCFSALFLLPKGQLHYSLDTQAQNASHAKNLLHFPSYLGHPSGDGRGHLRLQTVNQPDGRPSIAFQRYWR